MKSRSSFKWRERAAQQAAAEKATQDVKRINSQKIFRTIWSLFFITLVAVTIAMFVNTAIMDARDSIVAAINYIYDRPVPSPNPQYLPENYKEIEKIGTSSQLPFLWFWIFSFFTIILFLTSSIVRKQHEDSRLDYWAKVGSIVSAICAVVLGITSSLQAWKQITIAQYASNDPNKIVISVLTPNVVQPADSLIEVDRIGPFPTAKPLASEPVLPPSLAKMVCNSRKKIEKLGITSLLVVGRHDRQSFRTSEQVDSNAALAQRRADTVANYLQGEACGYAQRIMTVITVIGGPRIDGQPKSSVPDDREVDIFAISANKPNHK